MLTAQEIAAVPNCLGIDPHMSFAEVVWDAQIELDLIAEGQEAAEHYTRRQVRQLQKFVNDNRAALADSGGNGGAA